MRLILIRPLIMAAALATALVGQAACGADEEEGADGGARLQVVAAFAPLAEASGAVGGERVIVRNLTGHADGAHDHEPSADDIDHIRGADLLVYVGGGFQPEVEELAGRVRGQALDVLDAEALGGDDPHVWLDPVLMGEVVTMIEEALVALDEEGADDYRRNARALRERLDGLHADYESSLADCERNIVVVSHASFRFLTSRYGLEQEAVAGTSPEAEPDPGRLDALADLIGEGGVTTVFAEPGVPDRAIRTLARETGTEVALLDPIEASADNARGYFDRMEANLRALADGLDCSS